MIKYTLPASHPLHWVCAPIKSRSPSVDRSGLSPPPRPPSGCTTINPHGHISDRESCRKQVYSQDNMMKMTDFTSPARPVKRHQWAEETPRPPSTSSNHTKTWMEVRWGNICSCWFILPRPAMRTEILFRWLKASFYPFAPSNAAHTEELVRWNSHQVSSSLSRSLSPSWLEGG